MAGSTESIPSVCRKCLSSSLAVSKVGSTNTPATTVNGSRGSSDIPISSDSSPAATIVVIVGAILALAVMMVIVMVLRRKRIREVAMRGNGLQGASVDVAVDAAKGVNDDEERSGEGKWSAGAVELVVMAGESTPTFLAHPAPALTDLVSVAERPPLSSGQGVRD